jgi:Family of unknown function (DUF5670)
MFYTADLSGHRFLRAIGASNSDCGRQSLRLSRPIRWGQRLAGLCGARIQVTRPCDIANRPSRLRHGPCSLQDSQDERFHRVRSPERLEKSFNLKEEKTMLWTIIAILVVLWLLGFIGHIGGSLIHLLLVIAAVVLIFQLISGRRAVV